MRGMHLWAGAAIASLVVGMVAWLILSPGWAIGDLQQHVQVQLGRKLEVKGGAALSFSPSLAIRLDQVTLQWDPRAALGSCTAHSAGSQHATARREYDGNPRGARARRRLAHQSGVAALLPRPRRPRVDAYHLGARRATGGRFITRPTATRWRHFGQVASSICASS